MPMCQAYYENTHDNAMLAKRNQKTRLIWPGRVVAVSPNEVIKKLETLGVKKISRRTLLNYEKWGLIPEPNRGGAGKGKGRTTDYPDITPAELYASFKQIHGYYKLKPQQTADVRKIALKQEQEPFYRDDELSYAERHLAIAWVLDKLKVKNNIPLDKKIEIKFILEKQQLSTEVRESGDIDSITYLRRLSDVDLIEQFRFEDGNIKEHKGWKLK